MNPPASKLRIALIGDQRQEVKAHQAIPQSLALAAESLGCVLSTDWIATTKLAEGTAEQLRGYQGIWCAPGSPYASLEGALAAIRFARENGIPFLGTCGGCQHALVEYCRTVLGLADADHAESNPGAKLPLIVALPCALREVEASIRLKPGSRIRAIYGRADIREAFNCGFGLNPEHKHVFENSQLRIAGTGDDGNVRAVELEEHPFFVATLFQPERSAFKQIRHPLIAAFVQAASATTARLQQHTQSNLP